MPEDTRSTVVRPREHLVRDIVLSLMIGAAIALALAWTYAF